MQSFHHLEMSDKSIRELQYYEPPIIHILQKNPDLINWKSLTTQRQLEPILELVLDYSAMKMSMQPLAEEIAAYVFHPLRMNRIAEQYNIPFDELINDIY